MRMKIQYECSVIVRDPITHQRTLNSYVGAIGGIAASVTPGNPE